MGKPAGNAQASPDMGTDYEPGPVVCILSDTGPAILIRALELLKTAGLAMDLLRLEQERRPGVSKARLVFAASTDASRLAIVARKVAQLPGVHSVTPESEQ